MIALLSNIQVPSQHKDKFRDQSFQPGAVHVEAEADLGFWKGVRGGDERAVQVIGTNAVRHVGKLHDIMYWRRYLIL